MMARLLVLACVSFLLIACISAMRNGGRMEETGLAGLKKQQQKMVGEIQTIHDAVTQLKLDMKTLVKKASKTDEATAINMIDQLLAGAVNTGQLKSQTETSSDGSTHESTDISDDEMGTSMRPSHRQPDAKTRSDGSTIESSDLSDSEMGASMRHNSQPSTSLDLADDEMGTNMHHNSQPSTSSDYSDDEMGTNMRPSHSQSDPYKGMSMQSAGQSSGTSGLNMFSQLFAQAMKQQGVMQAADAKTRSDGSTIESSDLSDSEMGASMRHNSQPSTSLDLADDEMGTNMHHNSQPSTSSDYSDDEMGTNMRPSHSQSAGSARKDHYTWTLEGGLRSTQGEPLDKEDEDTDAYQLPSSEDVQTHTEGTAGQTSPDSGDDDK